MRYVLDRIDELTHRRKAAQKEANKPHSLRAAGAQGSTNTMLRLSTEDSKGLSVYVASSFFLTQ